MSNTEFEAKALDIDVEAITTKIKRGGGVHVADRLMRRYVYDIVPGVQGRWIRLRDTGTEVTLCVKHITSDEIDGTREEEVAVSCFDTTNALLNLMGFTAKAYQENRRTSYLLNGVRLEIDSWPLIPPYLEIEGDSTEDVIATAKIIDLKPSGLTAMNTVGVYTRYGIDLESIQELRFPD
ncbi:class IV adenylate cyclase [Streptomyces caatingaensis]|uniref:Adenylate cyclase n=1 Tax=Streptomyces caatingaensis TaxID=1678637 RepID=A0A0K9XJP2_9ACTN|nr:CYTH domain-containing protein [Streptomyces caatingaensis]KNB52877.1 adenylate cyclase [Streptomyces caatingaensis]